MTTGLALPNMCSIETPGTDHPRGRTHVRPEIRDEPIDATMLPCQDQHMANPEHPTRYTRTCPTISEVTTWYNDGAHESHSTRRCPAYGAPRRHSHRDVWARSTVTDAPTAWICARCTADDPLPDDAPVSKRGVATCLACDATMPVTKFPTVRVFGYQVRDTRRCRACGANGAPMPDAEAHFTRGMDDTPCLGPSWRRVMDGGRVIGWANVPGSGERLFDSVMWDTPETSEEAAA